MNGFEQKTPHHTMTLHDHCYHTYSLFLDMYIKDVFFSNKYYWSWFKGAVLHDVGKVWTQTLDKKGIAHYYNHAEIGSYVVLSCMKIPELWDNTEFLNCCFLINYHMMPFHWNTEKAHTRWKKIFGEDKYRLLIDFHKCDIAR